MPMFLVNFMAAIFLIANAGDNPKMSTRSWSDLSSLHQRSLPSACTNDHRRDIFHIYESVVKFGTSQMGKINDVVGNLADSSSDLFSRSQVQLDSFAGVALKYADYGCIRLDGGFFLRH